MNIKHFISEVEKNLYNKKIVIVFIIYKKRKKENIIIKYYHSFLLYKQVFIDNLFNIYNENENKGIFRQINGKNIR